MTIEFTGEERARIEGYFMAVFLAQAERPPRVATMAREINEVVKVDGRRLIAERSAAP